MLGVSTCNVPLDPHPHSHRRKRKQGAAAPERGGGVTWTGLSDRLRESLVDFSRLRVEGAQRKGRLDRVSHDKAKMERREERVVELLNAAVDHYAYGMELFDAWEVCRGE